MWWGYVVAHVVVATSAQLRPEDGPASLPSTKHIPSTRPRRRYARTLAELEEQTEMVILLGVATSGPARWCTLWSLWPLSVLRVMYSATQRAPVGLGMLPNMHMSVG